MSLDERLRALRARAERPDVERALAEVRRAARRARRARRLGAAGLAAAVVAAVVFVPRLFSLRDDPGGFITPAPLPTESGFRRCAKSPGDSRLIAYFHKGDLWLYDVTADEVRQLTDDGKQEFQWGPQFLNDSCVVYVSADSTALEVASLDGSRTQVILRARARILGFDISPDGSTIVYVNSVGSAHRLEEISLSRATPTVLRTLDPIGEGGAGSEGEVSVSWSPDGSRLLVTDTHTVGADGKDATESIHLLDAQGRDTRPPWSGTHARWSPNGRTIYYRGYAGTSGIAWHSLDVASGERTNLGMRPGANNLVVSPDGNRVAYDTSYFGETPREALLSGSPPDVYVYDFRSGVETLLKRGALGPVWVSSSELLVTDARAPDPQKSLNSWEPTGTVGKYTLAGRRTEVAITSTLWDPAVLLEPPPDPGR
ncbi:MAG: hypothetical protein WDA27_04900 [Actinomycetota bacterium]